jgi:hypothetical protein
MVYKDSTYDQDQAAPGPKRRVDNLDTRRLGSVKVDRGEATLRGLIQKRGKSPFSPFTSVRIRKSTVMPLRLLRY